jgi:DeoR/GlpR family transcriptional regulator of sugar metabolism
MGERLIPAQRRQRIRDYLEAHRIVQGGTLSELLQVSEATVRRDLARLEQEGGVERTHGGALLSQRLPTEPAYNRSALSHPEEKKRIGRHAAGLVEPGDTVFVNSGTTTSQLVRSLRESGIQPVTVVTNNIAAALEARGPGLEVIVVGGSFRPIAHSVVGRFALDTLRQIYAAKTFLGVDGISPKFGCTTPISQEAEIARLMVEHTRGPVYVVADHSKWGVVSNYSIARLDEIHGVVCDDGLAAEAREELAGRRVPVLIADDGEARPAAGGAPERFARV